MIFPLKKKRVNFNNSKEMFLNSYNIETEIPLHPHPGSFGIVRKKHIHEGIDLYCENGDTVFSMCDGRVVGIYQFTGKKVGSEWWNDTFNILIETIHGVMNYGEIIVKDNIKVGDYIKEGDELGFVTTVLKKNKGRPMNMLHFELYSLGTQRHIDSWDLDMQKPENLLNPTNLLINVAKENKLLK